MSISFPVRFALFLACCLMPALIAAQTLQDGERILFLGDSITQAGAQPNGYVSLVRQGIESNFPGKNIKVIGAGISGNRVPDLQKRLKRDVLDKKPTLVVIYIGINDVWHSQSGRGTSKEDYKAGLLEIIEQIQNEGARVVICTPSVIGEKHDGKNELDEMLEEFSQISRDVAAEKECQLLDLRKQFINYLALNNKENKASKVLTTDGVHLNAAGNQFVANQMIGALRMETSKTTGNVLRHVVLFKFNDGLEEAKIKEVVEAFADLKNKIDVVDGFEYGTNVSEENLSLGFTHCFVATFKSAADRDVYLPHEAHQAFVKLLDGKIDKVLVVDFWADE